MRVGCNGTTSNRKLSKSRLKQNDAIELGIYDCVCKQCVYVHKRIVSNQLGKCIEEFAQIKGKQKVNAAKTKANEEMKK